MHSFVVDTKKFVFQISCGVVESGLVNNFVVSTNMFARSFVVGLTIVLLHLQFFFWFEILKKSFFRANFLTTITLDFFA